jgi:parvulin-like peptidyl-prolyl isomerase
MSQIMGIILSLLFFMTIPALAAEKLPEAEIGANDGDAEASVTSESNSNTQQAPPPGVSSQTLPDKPPRVVMATIADEDITVEQFMQYISKRPNLVKKAADPAGKAEIVRELIMDRLFKLAMKKEGLVGDNPTAEDYQKALPEFSARHFSVQPPSDAAAYQYYLAHPQYFGIPEMVRVSQIQFRFPKDATDEEKSTVRGKAEAALDRLQKGELFPTVATELTEHPTGKVAGGDMGFLPLSNYPWLAQALKGLQIGQHTGVIESPVGYEILMLTDKRRGMVTPFANAKDKVIQSMTLEAKQKVMRSYARELQKTFPVTIEMEDLEGAKP